MEDAGDKPLRAMFEHCCTVYAAMEEEADRADAATLNDPDKVVLVYEGHLTKLFQEQGMSPPYYTTIRDLLIKMGCVEQLRRGGGNAKSRWLLVQPPTEEAFSVADALVKRPQGRVAMVEQGMAQLLKRVQRIEDALGLPSRI